MKNIKIFVINNPISIYYLITDACEQIDEIWIEVGVCPAIDNYLEEVQVFLQANFKGFIRLMEVPNIFESNRIKVTSKYGFYRKIAKSVSKMALSANVNSIVCSTTSAFRLCRVKERTILDHGTGDYLHSRASLMFDRIKFDICSRNIFYSRTSYASLLPVDSRTVIKIVSEFQFDQDSVITEINNSKKNVIILLVDPSIHLNLQITRLHNDHQLTNATVYLKFHHFHWARQVSELSSVPDELTNKIDFHILPADKQWLPVEAICMFNSSNILLVGFDSSALWHMSYFYPKRTHTLMSHSELKARGGVWGKNIDRLVSKIGVSPYER